VDVRRALPSLGDVTDAERQENRRRVLAVCTLAGVVPGVIAGLVVLGAVGWVAGVIVLVVVTAGVAAAVWRGSTGLALRALAARQPTAGEQPRLENLAQGLCATMGLAEPVIMVVDDPVPNACSVGRDERDAVVVVTTGLLQRLGLVELEGVMAHELAHVKRGDTAVAGVALTVLGPLCRMTGNDELMHRALGTGREYRADQIGVSAVRYPFGLRDALATFGDGPDPSATSPFAGRRWAATRWLWIDPMAGRRTEPSAGNLDHTATRLAALDEW
jgi:Zn-dependent protease with chaperone function